MTIETQTNDSDVIVTRHRPTPKPISDRARGIYGLLAALSPISLLITLGLAAGHAIAGDAGSLPALAMVVGVYQVIGTAMLVLFFGRDMLSQRGLSTTARMTWGASFIFLAPVALPIYWLAYLRPDSASRTARSSSEGESRGVVTTLPSAKPA